jgi:beta-lactam-binding protein with PASTA domain
MTVPQTRTGLRRFWPATVPGRDRLRIILILAGAALAGYLVTCVADPAPLIPRDREVARVLGLPLPEAEKELDEQGFKPKVEGEDADPVIPAGHIVWQDPPPETTLPGGTTIHLTVSSGPAAVSVPDVISFELDQARQVMDAAGLRIGTIDSIPSSSEPGMIIATRPPVGSSKPPGSAVDIVMSKGPADIRVPDVVGLKQEDARDRLEAAGLKVGLVTSRSAGRNPVGIVLEQRPGAGALSPHEGRVSLVISN